MGQKLALNPSTHAFLRNNAGHVLPSVLPWCQRFQAQGGHWLGRWTMLPVSTSQSMDPRLVLTLAGSAFGYGQGDIGGLMVVDSFRRQFPEMDVITSPTLPIANVAVVWK